MASIARVRFAVAQRRSGSRVGAIVVGKFRPVPPECTESSLTLFVWLKWHIVVLHLLGRRADGQFDEGAAIQAEPVGAFVQDFPPFRRDADG